MGLIALIFLKYFNFPGINWEYHIAATSKSEKFLKRVEDNFLSQALTKTTRKVTKTTRKVLDLLFENKEDLVLWES